MGVSGLGDADDSSTGFAARDDVPGAVVAGEGAEAVRRLVLAVALDGQIAAVLHQRPRRHVDEAVLHRRHHARRCASIQNPSPTTSTLAGTWPP